MRSKRGIESWTLGFILAAVLLIIIFTWSYFFSEELKDKGIGFVEEQTEELKEICDNNMDDDGDGLDDCDDSDCEGTEPCMPEFKCNDKKDNDRDGLIDCRDPDCDGKLASVGARVSYNCEYKEKTCRDGKDNDADGLIDCRDPDCDGISACEFMETTCDDGYDNDADGATDTDDVSCQADLTKIYDPDSGGDEFYSCSRSTESESDDSIKYKFKCNTDKIREAYKAKLYVSLYGSTDPDYCYNKCNIIVTNDINTFGTYKLNSGEKELYRNIIEAFSDKPIIGTKNYLEEGNDRVVYVRIDKIKKATSRTVTLNLKHANRDVSYYASFDESFTAPDSFRIDFGDGTEANKEDFYQEYNKKYYIMHEYSEAGEYTAILYGTYDGEEVPITYNKTLVL